jgi:bla regulator protein blaR1
MSALMQTLAAPQTGRLGWTLLHFVWQGALVAAVLAVSLRLLRKRSAGLRYIVATGALLVLAVAPVATLMVVPGPVAQSAASVPAENAAAPGMADFEPVDDHGLPRLVAEDSALTGVVAGGAGPDEPEATGAGSAPEVKPGATRSAELASGWGRRIEPLLRPWLPHVVGAWVLGVLVLLLWRLVGWTQIRRLTRRGVLPVPAELRALLAELSGRLRVTRPVRLLVSGIAVVPSVVGWLRPVVLLPVAALSGLTPEQLEAILAHELAHVRRHDYLVNMIQVVIETLLFYHPAVWWISNTIRAEREDCCDDLAVAACGNRIAYARALSAMEDLRAAPSPSLAASGGKLLPRIRRIVGLSDSESPSRWSTLAILSVIFILAIAVPLGCLRPPGGITVEVPVEWQEARISIGDFVLDTRASVLAGEKSVFVRLAFPAAQKASWPLLELNAVVQDRGTLVVWQQGPLADAVLAKMAGGRHKAPEANSQALLLIVRPEIIVLSEEMKRRGFKAD